MQKTVYKTAKPDAVFRQIYGLLFLFMISLLVVPYILEPDKKMLLTLGLIVIPVLIMLFLCKRISVMLTAHSLMVKISEIKVYSVEVHDIVKIKKGETLWVGMHKYGTRTGGLIISAKYKDDLYITPENQEEFLKKLMLINPDIKVERNKLTDHESQISN